MRIQCSSVLRTVSLRREAKPSQPRATPLRIRAEAFFDVSELVRIKDSTGRNSCALLDNSEDGASMNHALEFT